MSFFIARQSPLEIIAYTARTISEHPPGYYLLLHFWIQVAGSSEFALRFCALLGSMLALALLAVLARRWFGDRVAILAALLLAIEPMAVQYAIDARMYSWLIAATLLMVYLFDRALSRNRWRDWLAFIVAAGVAVSMHYLAALVVLACVAFFIIRWTSLAGRRKRFATTLLTLAGLPAIWVLAGSGTRGSALRVATALVNSMQHWTIGRLEPTYTHWALGGIADTLAPAQTWLPSILPWALAVIGIVAVGGTRTFKRRDMQWLLALLVAAPIVAASFLFDVLNARHVLAGFGLFVLAIAVGLAFLLHRVRLVGIVALVALLGYYGWYGSTTFKNNAWRPFSPAVRYVEEHAADSEPVLFTDALAVYFNNYYNYRHLPEVYIPPRLENYSDAYFTEQAAATVSKYPSFWLVSYPAQFHPERLAQALNQVGFAAEKQWFDASRYAVHYFSPRPLQPQPGGMSWENGVTLKRWLVSGATLAAGDALRLQFEWQRTEPVADPAMVGLSLYGPDGAVWARRVGVPCNDDCPVTSWSEAVTVDRAAFMVPPDLPPGDYELRLGWLKPDGTRLLGTAAAGQAPAVELPLLKVHVQSSAGSSARAPLPQRFSAAFGASLTLIGADELVQAARPGDTVSLTTQWQVTGPQPALDAHLVLHSTRGGGNEVTVPAALGPDWYPSRQWQPGIVRTILRFELPPDIAPGDYQAGLSVAEPGQSERGGRAPVGTLTVEDRPRQFTVPQQGVPLGIAWQNGATLARVAVPDQAAPGATVPVTLIWQAGGPLGRNWKVFVHLIGPDGKSLAQHDGYPAAGSAPAMTWQAGEVIVDEHPVQLPEDLPGGSYRWQIGFYDEGTNERLNLAAGDNALVLPLPLQVAP